MLVVPQEGALELLDSIRNSILAPSVQVAIFVNNYFPVETSLLADFTEATFPGYARGVTVFGSAPFLNGSNQAEIDAGIPAVFAPSASSGEVGYGYFIPDPLNPRVLWAERFASPVPFSTIGVGVSVVPQLTLVTQFTGP